MVYRFPKKKDDKKLYPLRAPYIEGLKSIFETNSSIISSNCFAGRIMQDLGLQYNSPTVGLYFWSSDYIEFLRDLRFYLTEARIVFVDHSKYSLGNERRKHSKHWYPIGLLDGKVEIHFLHYYTKEEAAEKWYRRANRINWDNLFLIGMEQNLCSEKDIRAFDQLPYFNKIFFSSKELPDVKSNCFVEEFKGLGEVGDPYKNADVFYRELLKKIKT